RSSRVTAGDLAAVVSFTSPQLSGSLGVISQAAYAQELNRKMGLSEGQAGHLIRDAASQIIARFKTELLRFDVQLKPGFPIVSENSSLSLTYVEGRTTWTQRLR